jgi:hypothetical protein
MERNTNAKGGFWMMVEDLNTEPIKENDNVVEKKAGDDEFYPDASI